ncbi:hypothetical protein MSG28_006980 [Choristoneura fumiferana]|uniref:Uncharacterized protein n=1 Tax=Choristoneura fumiferana TaxID=7141 RepID=A0ACC0JLW5_CHOFU|nr:hypothetical protein MSG28_006980 [Choristoneura fumiferana]
MFSIWARPLHSRPLNELSWGVCVPASCGPGSVERLLATMLARSHLSSAGMRARIKITEDCQIQDQPRAAFMAILTAAALLGTYLNSRRDKTEPKTWRYNVDYGFICFTRRLVCGHILLPLRVPFSDILQQVQEFPESFTIYVEKILMVFFVCAVYPYTGSGPLWPRGIAADTDQCRKNWWLSLLMLNNYIDSENICIVVSWYIPADFHCFCVSVLLYWLYKRCPRLAGASAVVITIIAIILPGVINYVYDMPAVQLFTYDCDGDGNHLHLAIVPSTGGRHLRRPQPTHLDLRSCHASLMLRFRPCPSSRTTKEASEEKLPDTRNTSIDSLPSSSRGHLRDNLPTNITFSSKM